MTDEKQTVISVLRALIVSSPQRGKSIRDLRRDYCEFEGKRQVPIFEHRNLEDFLRASGGFIFENIVGELIVYEKPSLESNHISKLVAEQSKPKRRSSSSSRSQRFVRRPQFGSQINFARSNSTFSSTKSPSKSIFPRKFGSNVSKPSPIPVNQRSQTSIGFTFEQLKAKQMATEPTVLTNNSSQLSGTQRNDMNQSTEPFDLRNRLNESRRILKTNPLAAPKPVACIDLTSDDSYSRMQHDDRHSKEYPAIESRISENSMRSLQGFAAPLSAPICYTSTDVKQISPSPLSAPYTSTIGKLSHPRMSTPGIKQLNPFFDINQPSPTRLPSRIQDRLKYPPNYTGHASVIKNVSCNNEKKSTLSDRLVQARLSQSSTSPVIDLTKDSNDKSDQNEIRSSFQSKVPSHAAPILSATVANNYYTNLQFQIDSLHRYCVDNQLGDPKFRLFKFKATNRLQCQVTVNDVRYSTYPAEYETELEAQSETAKYALQRLLDNDNLMKYPICLDEEADMIIKIYKCIQDSPTGVFSKKIPQKFQTAYQESLPVDWMQLVEKNEKFFTIDECIDEKIVCVVEKTETDDDIQCEKMDKLVLPWNEEYWSLLITCVTSTVEIWGRLIGKEYSQSLDAVIIDIEMDLITNKVVATEFNIGQIYLVLISECGYRVRIEKVDNPRQQCLCFFIDEGDHRWFEMKEIFICQSKFTKFPAQAIRFSLHGLEDFAENEFARPHLEELLLNKSLIGQIYTKQNDFILLDESEDMEAIVHVVFYDTSTEDDINLHPVIVDKICASVPAPHLLPTKLTPVYISHIADNGDIFCQLQMNGVHYVNKLIRKWIDRNKEPQTFHLNGQTDKEMYVLYDEDTSKWCRGCLIQEGEKENIMHLIDYGQTKNVPLTQMYRLETLSQALLTFPPQALKTKLYGIENMPENLISMLRGSFSAGTLAYVKVQNLSSIPEIKLYLIKDPHIICINDSFECHQALEEMSPSSFSSQISSSSTVSADTKYISENKTDEFMPNLDKLNIDSGKSAALPKLSPFPAPKVGSYFAIEVVMASNPGNFVIRSNKCMPQWVEQMKSLQEYCKKSPVLNENMIEVGQPYACLHSDGSWYRAIVEFHRHTKIIMYFCDLGEIDNIDDVTKLKFLPQEYRMLPKLALTAKLFGIKPTSKDWDMDDYIQFNRLTVGKKFQSIVEKIQENENAVDNALLELKLIDVSTDDDICINDIFVESGRAIRI